MELVCRLQLSCSSHSDILLGISALLRLIHDYVVVEKEVKAETDSGEDSKDEVEAGQLRPHTSAGPLNIRYVTVMLHS